MNNNSRSADRIDRRGLSLLEVIIALAILGLGLATIGELIRIGTDSAKRARQQTTAQLLCQNKLEEIRAGILPPESIGPLNFEIYETDQPWMYTIERQQFDAEGLLQITVTVEEVTTAIRPMRFFLTTWMIDPELELLQQQAADQAAAAAGG
jgi:type II secretion system protein I